MTSAPNSAMSVPQNGPATTWASSNTRRPSSARRGVVMTPRSLAPRCRMIRSVPEPGRRTSMKIAIIGQQDFGKAALEAFVARKDDIAGVFCAPEKPGARVDALRAAAQERGVPVFQFASLRSPEAHAAMQGLGVDLGAMAYVLPFASA